MVLCYNSILTHWSKTCWMCCNFILALATWSQGNPHKLKSTVPQKTDFNSDASHTKCHLKRPPHFWLTSYKFGSSHNPLKFKMTPIIQKSTVFMVMDFLIKNTNQGHQSNEQTQRVRCGKKQRVPVASPCVIRVPHPPSTPADSPNRNLH